MKESKKNAYKLEFGMDVFGISRAIWVYESVPSGMRPAKLSDLVSGRAVLHPVRTGPDQGKYYTSYVTPSTREALLGMIRNGIQIFVQDA